MKRYWVLNFVFAAIFIASTAMQTSTTPPGVPADTTKLRVEMTDKGQLRLQVHGENNTGKKLRLAIVKKESSSLSYASESVIYNEFIKADNVNFERVLNLSQLENGTYEIEVTGGKQRFVRSITLQTTAEAVQKPREIVF
jgi:hypothetical protein